MAWARLDDGFHDDPAMLEVGLDGCGLYARGLSYSCKHLTDGFLPDVWVRAQVPSTRANATGVVERLVATGCWIPEARGFRIKDFLDYNPSRETVKANRTWDAKRKELSRDPELITAIRRRDRDRCRYCGIKVDWKDRRSGKGATYDHVVPRGENTLDNVVVACRKCNTGKGGRTPAEASMPLLGPGSLGQNGPDPIKGSSVPGTDTGQNLVLPPIPSHPIEEQEPGGAMSVVREPDPPLVDLSVDESGRAAA